MNVVVFDYGLGNVRSAVRALAHVGAEVSLTGDVDAALAADGLVVPGVGAFAACMDALVRAGGDDLIYNRVADARPVLGICVGMQMLFARGIEHGLNTKGLCLFPATVEKLDAPVVPHMGWTPVEPAPGSRLFAGIEDERFYFVHSYAVSDLEDDDARRRTWATHGGNRFLAAVESGSLSGTQFHPEKSGDAGLALLENWINTL